MLHFNSTLHQNYLLLRLQAQAKTNTPQLEAERARGGATCSRLKKRNPHMVYIQASIFVHMRDQANSSHRSPHNTSIIQYMLLLTSSQLLFHCRRKAQLTKWGSLMQRKGNSCGGRAAREAVTFSLYKLTNLFPSMWQNMAHSSFIGFLLYEAVSSWNTTVRSSEQ